MSDVEIATKKPKMSSEEEKTQSPVSCVHWIQRKKRFCKLEPMINGKFCAEHQAISIEIDALAEGNKRIPCPLDPKHTVYKHKLQKHLKICNARPTEAVQPAYIQKGINAAGKEDSTSVAGEDYTRLKLHELADEEFYSVIKKVKSLFKEFIEGKILKREVQHAALNEELAKAENGKNCKKHLLQTAALLGILEQEQQLQDSTSYIEFGAGKGQLAFYLANILEQQKDSHIVLLDRMSLRHKKDNRIENRSLITRLRVDIADFKMSQFDKLESTKRIVALSKHLCGAATDLTLRCIADAKTDFVMIALCCHHRCEWRPFVGQDFFKAHDVSEREFVIITKMVSWAICGTGMSRARRRELEEQPIETAEKHQIVQRLAREEREEIGFMCKRVLDHARIEYLQQHGFEAMLTYYVPQEVTLENVCLIAKRCDL